MSETMNILKNNVLAIRLDVMCVQLRTIQNSRRVVGHFNGSLLIIMAHSLLKNYFLVFQALIIIIITDVVWNSVSHWNGVLLITNHLAGRGFRCPGTRNILSGLA